MRPWLLVLPFSCYKCCTSCSPGSLPGVYKVLSPPLFQSGAWFTMVEGGEQARRDLWPWQKEVSGKLHSLRSHSAIFALSPLKISVLHCNIGR